MMWKTAAAILPAAFASLFFFRRNAFVLIAASCLSAALAEIVGRIVFKKKRGGSTVVTNDRGAVVADGSVVLTGLIFSLLLPPATPAWMAAAGSFIAVFLGREMCGGLGANRFNPALVGLVFLHGGFPQLMNPSITMVETIPVLFLLAGGLFLVWQKLVRWEIPALYLLLLFFSSVLISGDRAPAMMPGIPVLFAFFVVTDPVTTPVTRKGRRLFAVATAVLAALLNRWSPSSEAAMFPVLFLNALVPWIDRRVRPSGAYRKKE